MQNIVKQDPGRVRQDRFGTAGTKFSQPHTKFFQLYRVTALYIIKIEALGANSSQPSPLSEDLNLPNLALPYLT